MKKILAISLFCFVSVVLNAQTAENSPYKRHIDKLASEEFVGRKAATKGDTLAVNYIVSELQRIQGVKLLGDNGLQVVPFEEKVRGNADGLKIPKTTFNVAAMVEATETNNPSGEIVVIGAHYDHVGIKTVDGEGKVCYGADDNASGVAYLIELARKIVEERENLKRDVVFVFFGAEELGLIGSGYFANNPLVPAEKIKVMVNFDMLGRMNAKGLTVRGVGTAKEAVYMFAALPNPDKLELIWEMRGKGPTDYASFYRKGIPAFSFSTRTHKDYHTPADTPDKINYEGMDMADAYIMSFVKQLIFGAPVLTYQEQ